MGEMSYRELELMANLEFRFDLADFFTSIISNRDFEKLLSIYLPAYKSLIIEGEHVTKVQAVLH